MPSVHSMRHPDLGSLEWEPGERAWQGWIHLPPFADYGAEAIQEADRLELQRLYRESGSEWDEPAAPEETEADRRFRAAEFPLSISPPERPVSGLQSLTEWWKNRGKPPEAPGEAQVRAFQRLAAAPERIALAIMEVTFDLYREELPSWRRDGLTSVEAEAVRLPVLKSADGLKRLLELTGVHILGREREGEAFCEFRFRCSWDDEHGYEVYTHRERAWLELPA